MTSEVVIANNQCVVMAADSAVTTAGSKVHDSALKLFSLSKTEPVGVMIYGSASYLGTPWETIIKVFCDELCDEKLPSLKSYCERFVEHLDAKLYWSSLRQGFWVEFIVAEVLEDLKQPLRQYIRQCATQAEQFSQDGATQIIRAWFEEKKASLEGADIIYSDCDAIASRIREEFDANISALVSQELEVIDANNSAAAELVIEIVCYLLVRPYEFQTATGIVIAGYGDKQLYPEIVSIKFDGVIDGTPRHWLDEPHSADLNDEDVDAVVLPFAQDDVMNTLLCGISPRLEGFLGSVLSSRDQYLLEALRHLENHMEGDLAEAVSKLCVDVESRWDEFQQGYQKFVQANFMEPLFTATSSLTKADMAMMAETLVNVTAFKRKISMDVNSVGGPVDVAVLSKGDGLVWVKRKHYFPPELNYHFFQNYLRGY